MYKNQENTLISVNNESELPVNLRNFYEIINESDKVVSTYDYGQNYLCFQNKAGEYGLFQRKLITEKGEMYLPSRDNAPLFIKLPGKIVVIAPCEMPEAMILGGI